MEKKFKVAATVIIHVSADIEAITETQAEHIMKGKIAIDLGLSQGGGIIRSSEIRNVVAKEHE